MRSSLAFILGAGSAMAQFTNSSMPMPVPTGAPDNKAFPNTVGEFKFLGCLTGTFPGFKKMASDDKMTLDLCAASCPSQIMGVVGNNERDCFCADTVDSSASKKDDKSKCNLPCPGMPEEHCGGMLSKMKRADVVPAGSAMTAYMREGGSSSSSSNGGSGGTTSKASSKTVTSTYVSTITSCPPSVTNCPVGSKTHKVVVETVAVCPQPKWHAKKIECHNNHCAPEYACEGKHCKHQRVICVDGKCQAEECNTNDWHKLVICKGKDCKYSQCKGAECDKKVVCYNGNCVVEQCYGKECDKNMVCKGDKCGWQSCKSGDASCKKEITCNGDDCKVRPNPTGPMPAPGPKPTQNKDQNNKGQNNNGQNNNGQNKQRPEQQGARTTTARTTRARTTMVRTRTRTTMVRTRTPLHTASLLPPLRSQLLLAARRSALASLRPSSAFSLWPN
ncbi:Carbohydrate-binding WSC [Akanthomyces lecanii RCEF 1005]|uniref:Carbohydrate-binding WSC n=1 Tax=Akanthomyces lecanii RCEF 1005 TaxID=1081108 RepID=A0A168G0M0_CORDF|nr:Carbohydrate-binding WSC [Akanthomyces lecanii RCEF 1005]